MYVRDLEQGRGGEGALRAHSSSLATYSCSHMTAQHINYSPHTHTHTHTHKHTIDSLHTWSPLS